MNLLVIRMLSIIKNGYKNCKQKVYIYNFNNFCLNILHFLYKEGFISMYYFDFKLNCIIVSLKYLNGRSALSSISMISSVSNCVYIDVEMLSKYKNNLGMFVLSTSLGILSSEQALKLKVGGILLFFIF